MRRELASSIQRIAYRGKLLYAIRYTLYAPLHLEGGLTMVELLLSTSLLFLIVAVSLPIFWQFQVRTDLATSVDGIVAMLRRSQVYARGVLNDSQWGVHIAVGTATLYKGATFVGSPVDETITLPADITKVNGSTSGTADFNMAKLTGLPASSGSFTIESVNATVCTITIGTKGVITASCP